MSTPDLYDIHETSKRVRMSVSWLYRNAGVTIPVTHIAGTKRHFWTGEQIEQIIRDGAQSPKSTKRTPRKRESVETAAAPRLTAVRTPGVKIPQARPERSRRYRPTGTE